MEYHKAYCSVFDCYAVIKLQGYNKPIDFKGETTIKVHFMNINSQKKAIKKLNMETNDSIQMVLMFELIKSQGDFNDAISK